MFRIRIYEWNRGEMSREGLRTRSSTSVSFSGRVFEVVGEEKKVKFEIKVAVLRFWYDTGCRIQGNLEVRGFSRDTGR